MARANPTDDWYGSETERGAPPSQEDWHALRDRLTSLLDHVEGRREAGEGAEPAPRRAAGAAAQSDPRHSAALRTVQRAVERFTERDEARPMPPSPHDMLQSAIDQIRSRQRGQVRPPARPAPAAEHGGYAVPQHLAPQPQFEALAAAISGMSERLERFEAEVRGQRASTESIGEIAAQVAQLTGVVEMLATTVGEQGQIKQLESQIVTLAQAIAESNEAPQIDLSGLTSRLDDMTGTVDRLSRLQSEQAAREAEDASTRAEAHRENLGAIEAGVRNIYDRIDAIEQSYALSPADIEKLTAEMAGFTRAMQQSEGAVTTGLIERVEAINARMADLEETGGAVGALREDIAALRGAVVGAVEPRFLAIEQQLDTLGTRIAEVPAATAAMAAGTEALEAQIRQLIVRMDQTGAQLSQLADHYAEPPATAPEPDYERLADMIAARAARHAPEPAPAPDYEHLAEMIAQRAARSAPDLGALADRAAEKASSAVAEQAASPAAAPTPAGLDPETAEVLRTIERRLGAFLDARRDEPGDGLAEMRAGIAQVDDRLGRLEEMLRRPPEAPAALVAEAAPSSETPSAATPEADAARPLAGRHFGPAGDAGSESEPSRPPHPGLHATSFAATPGKVDVPRHLLPDDDRDAMPEDPTDEAPVNAPPFPAPRVETPLPRRSSASRPEPEASGTGGTTVPTSTEVPRRPPFDPETIERPAQPRSSFADANADAFGAGPSAAAPPVEAPPRDGAEDIPNASRNSFIEAARRAAQRQQASAPAAGSGSLIGRAFARFQPGGTSAAPAAETTAPQAPVADDKPAPRDRAAAKAAKAEARARKAEEKARARADADAARAAAGEQGFFTRYRRLILLAALLVAVSLLTLNLIGQRMGGEAPVAPPADDAPAIEDAPPAADTDAAPAADDPAPADDPDAVPDVPATVGSIDPARAVRMIEPASAEMPRLIETTALQSEVFDEAAPEPAAVLAEPAVVHEPPPAPLGPVELLDAAANGDARAQFEVAAIYSEGQAVEQDLVAAAVWYERAAAQGFAPAGYRLANLYETGRGVEQDLQQARLWYQRAAESGNRMSMHNLASLYAGGELGTQDFESAAEWFENAAERGMTDSQFNLGMLHARGLGVPQDLEASFRWFAIAAASGDQDAVAARDDIARSLDAEAVSRLEAEIADWQAAAIDIRANYAPLGTWSDSFDPGEAIENRDIVGRVQTVLARLGYDAGGADGLIGPKTRDAIRAFERETGMTETGEVNPRLLAVLGSQPA